MPTDLSDVYAEIDELEEKLNREKEILQAADEKVNVLAERMQNAQKKIDQLEEQNRQMKKQLDILMKRFGGIDGIVGSESLVSGENNE